MKVVVCHQFSHLLNEKILNYPLKCPHFHTSSHLKTCSLVGDTSHVQQHHLYEQLPFGFKTTFTLNSVIMKSDNDISYISSTSYSCWCSHLNQTIHIAWSPNHVSYSVTLGTKGQMISCLSTRAPVQEPQSSLTKMRITLYHFHGLFSTTTQKSRGCLPKENGL